jgi:1-acyl-sn-glycerol-3-phosphate acyltransferase
LDEVIRNRMRQFPRKPGAVQHAFRTVAACAIRAWLNVYHRFEMVGRNNLPSAGSFVMVANHASHLDALCLLSALPLGRLHQAFPAAASDYFFQTLPRVALSVFIINAMPFDRAVDVRGSLKRCRQLLAVPGNILILFPEGTRGTGGRIGPFRPGIGKLLAQSEVPVVPCHLSGTQRALPKGAWLPRPRRIRLTIGTPQSFERCSQERGSIRSLCNSLRRGVLALGGIEEPAGAGHPGRDEPGLALATDWGDE